MPTRLAHCSTCCRLAVSKHTLASRWMTTQTQWQTTWNEAKHESTFSTRLLCAQATILKSDDHPQCPRPSAVQLTNTERGNVNWQTRSVGTPNVNAERGRWTPFTQWSASQCFRSNHNIALFWLFVQKTLCSTMPDSDEDSIAVDDERVKRIRVLLAGVHRGLQWCWYD